MEGRRCHDNGPAPVRRSTVRHRRGGQWRRRDDRRAGCRAPRPACRGAGEDGLVRRLHRPLWRRHLGARQRGTAQGRRPGHAGAGPRLPGTRGGRLRPGGAAASAARARPGHARPRARRRPRQLHLGAELRRLLPGGSRRPGPGAQHRAGAARRADARDRAGPPQSSLPPGAQRHDHHPGRLPVAQPRPPAPPGHARLCEGPRPAGAHAPAPGAHPQHGPGLGGRPAGRPDGEGGTGMAGHPHDRPARGGWPGHGSPGDPRRAARADPGEPRRRGGGATSASRSAPSGLPAQPATPATR